MHFLPLILILLLTPAEAQNNPCRGLSEAACRADYRCTWPFTSGYCVQTPFGRPPQPQQQPQTGPNLFDIAVWIFLIGFFGWIVRYIYRLATEGRKPVEELKSAEQHLRAAYNYIKPIWDVTNIPGDRAGGYIVHELTIAAEHLVHARNLDPRCQIHIEERGKYELYTLDQLTFLALYLEADLYHKVAQQGNPSAFVNKDYRRLTEGRKALNAIDKALNYKPTNAAALTLRGTILAALGRREEAREAATAALHSNPSFMPAQKLRDTL